MSTALIPASLGALQVNAADYGAAIVIERFSYWGTPDPQWAVPAWEEWGRPDLAGPFATVAQAQSALLAA